MPSSVTIPGATVTPEITPLVSPPADAPLAVDPAVPGEDPVPGPPLEPSLPVAAPLPASLDPGRKDMHRLNTAEYNATVQDVLGVALLPADGSWRGGELAGFDNMAAVQGMDSAQYERYFDAAKTLAAEVFASDELRKRFVSCDAAAPECARSVVTQAGLRLFRRPLTTTEVDRYSGVYDTALSLGDAPLDALQLAFQALLSSADFIYRIEFDDRPDSLDPHPLSAFELASRLAYFLWSSAPDEALLAAAADGSLLLPGALAQTVDRMLADPKAERWVTNFAGQWLGARRLPSHAVALEVDRWPRNTAHGAGQEIYAYFREFIQSDLSWFDFLSTDINFVNEGLSRIYGIRRPPVDGLARVEITEDERAGFFGLVGFLAQTSFDRRTSPSKRGHWIVSNFLCAPPPDAPPGVDELTNDAVDIAKLDVREALQLHSQSPGCASCHQLFDPYGLVLEQYNPVGKLRSSYADGSPIDASAVLPASAATALGGEITGLQGLSAVVAEDPRFADCLGKTLLTYGLGRPVTNSDEPHLKQAQEQWLTSGETPSIRRLIRALVTTEAFRYRRGQQRIEP